MRPGIHPACRPAVFRDRAADALFLTRSSATPSNGSSALRPHGHAPRLTAFQGVSGPTGVTPARFWMTSYRCLHGREWSTAYGFRGGGRLLWRP